MKANSLSSEKLFTLIVGLFTVLLTSCNAAASTSTPSPPAAATVIPTSDATLSAGAIVYAIDPGDSLIKYVATGILNSQYPGTFKVTGQMIAFVPEQNGYRVKLELTFDLRSATAMDSFMRNTLLNSLEVDQYSVATLSLTSSALTQTPDSLQSANFTLDGVYMLHGHQKTVELPVTITTGTDSLQLDGSMDFNLSDYGVHVPAVLVQDPINFTANLSAQRSF